MGSPLDFYSKTFQDSREKLAGNSLPWLNELRNQAMDRFLSNGFPTPKNEEWKYTDVAEIAAKSFEPNLALAAEDLESGKPLKAEYADLDNCLSMVFLNGRWLMLNNGHITPPPGMTITSMGKMLSEFPDRIKTHLARTDHEENSFFSLNTAFMSDGAYLYLDKNTVSSRPVLLTYLTGPGERRPLTFPRNLIVLEEGSEAVLIERYVAQNDSVEYFTNAITEIKLGKNAKLEHIRLENEAKSAYHISATQVNQEANSRYFSYSFSFGAALSRSELTIRLDASGADCRLNGLYVGKGNQHIDNHTRIDHKSPYCTSRELYKGILSDTSRGVFNGKIYVHPNAQKTAADQSNPNLLLSRKAEIDTKPQLEIFADDVKCSHGATIGQLEDQAVFFLRSRGIDVENARSILIHAFADEIIGQIRMDSLRRQIEGDLKDQLPEAKNEQEIF